MSSGGPYEGRAYPVGRSGGGIWVSASFGPAGGAEVPVPTAICRHPPLPPPAPSSSQPSRPVGGQRPVSNRYWPSASRHRTSGAAASAPATVRTVVAAWVARRVFRSAAPDTTQESDAVQEESPRGPCRRGHRPGRARSAPSGPPGRLTSRPQRSRAGGTAMPGLRRAPDGSYSTHTAPTCSGSARIAKRSYSLGADSRLLDDCRQDRCLATRVAARSGPPPCRCQTRVLRTGYAT